MVVEKVEKIMWFKYVSVFVVFMTLFVITSSVFGATIRDPEHETHYKVYFGYFYNKIIIGVDYHYPIDTENDFYFDTKLGFILEDFIRFNWSEAFLFENTVQYTRLGYRRTFLAPKSIKYRNMVFGETLE